jgi:hypothetical protein
MVTPTEIVVAETNTTTTSTLPHINTPTPDRVLIVYSAEEVNA